MSKPMKKAKTLKLLPEVSDSIERIAAREGVPQHVVVARAVWYYETLESRLAEALDSLLIPKMANVVQRRNEEFMMALAATEGRILEGLSSRKP